MNAPTLIVGLGGTGSKVVLRVADMVTEEERQRIGFAVFDTDVNELRTISDNNPFVHTIQTSTKLSVGEYLDIDKRSRDSWFPVNAILNSKTLTEGAGQVRAVSRMAFETALRAGKMEELHKAIEELYKLEGEDYSQALRVIIVSSLAGGTGSGIILPVALYIKNYLATHFRQSANITRGFFLLPEVFFGVIQGNAERNNLKSNAYATLRELDAFLMKGDATLPDKYKNSVKMEFPNVGSGEYEEYEVRPFDFCFLFDAQNADGKKLNSFTQYLDHAAACIYAQSIGPMNKRSNSSEDNTIRKLCAERGRNRYAGAGTSMLIYPVNDIKRYLALNWATECVSDQWMVYDKLFKERVAENKEKKKQGVATGVLKENVLYMSNVETMHGNKDPFSTAIAKSCSVYDETGFEKKSDKWTDYYKALVSKIQRENCMGQAAIDKAGDEVQSAFSQLIMDGSLEVEEAWGPFIDAYHKLVIYKSLIQKRIDEDAYTIAYSIFRAKSNPSDRSDFRLETYMRDEKGEFIHPNASRYFLYKVLEKLEAEYKKICLKNRDTIQYFDTFEEKNFDNSETEEKETVEQLAETKSYTKWDKLRKRQSADMEDLQSAYNTFLQKCNEYRKDGIMEAVLKEGIDHVRKLCNAFEVFYKSLDSRIAGMSREIANIENKYDHLKGTATRYVCVSKKCLNGFADSMPYTGGVLEIDGKLASTIFAKINDYTLEDHREDQPDTNFFTKLFNDEILKYFENSVMENYGTEVDLDIIEAIEKEYFFETGDKDYEKAMMYTRDVFRLTKSLAAPFIEKPLGEEKDPINACAYNNKLKKDTESPRSLMIDAELANFGGVADEDIPKNKILFYKSFYGLRANDLSKFAPPQKAETYNRTGGEYYKAYYELVSKIHPLSYKSKVITPHIDRWWHNVAMMPDLDDENQTRQENEIYSALFWGLLNEYIKYCRDGRNKETYKFMIEELDMSESNTSDTLVVSNGTPCDKLYEVLDALSIYPELVSNIIRFKEDVIREEVDDNLTLAESSFMKDINSFTLREFSAPGVKVRSIFDLPLLMKQSLTSDLYEDEKIWNLIKVEIDEIKTVVSRFCTEREYVDTVSELIWNQFNLFIDNIEATKKQWNGLYQDAFFSRTCSVIAKSLDELGVKDYAQEIKNKVKELSRKEEEAENVASK